MENVKFVIPAILICFFVFSFPAALNSYEANTTHRALTSEALKLYADTYPGTFSAEDEGHIKNGSVLEDEGIRALHHFFDPINNSGLTVGLVSLASSKEWAKSSDLQIADTEQGNSQETFTYFEHKDDYSWDRAVYEYVYGDRGRALETLGHVLHLVEDLAVPEHVRNDPHMPYLDGVSLGLISERSPYEAYAGQYTENNVDIAHKLEEAGKGIVYRPTLASYFDSLATQTNTHFFSKDTLPDSGRFNLPAVDIKDVVDSNGFVEKEFNGVNYKLLKVFANTSSDGTKEINYRLDDDSKTVLSSYWNILSQEAVRNAAGVIDLFFKDVEKEKQTRDLLLRSKSGKWRIYVQSISSLWGLTTNAIGPVVAKVVDTIRSTFTSNAPTQTGLDNLAFVAGPFLGDLDIQEPSKLSVNKDSITNYTVTDSPSTPVLSGSEEQRLHDASLILQQAIHQVNEMTDILNSISQENDTHTDSSEGVILNTSTPLNYQSVLLGNFIAGGGAPLLTKTEEPVGNTDEVTDTEGNATSTQTTNEDVIEETTEATSTPSTTEDEDSTTSAAALDIDCSNSFSPDSCLVPVGFTVTLEPHTTLTASSTEYYEYSYNNTIATTTANAFDILLASEQDIDVYIAIKDSDKTLAEGNITIFTKMYPVVINEIAWMGTQASVYDEWIELHNPTTKNIDLNGWTLKTADDGLFIDLSGTIAAGGYYLLERTDDDTISDITADLIYGNDGSSYALSNIGEQLQLVYDGTVLDATPVPHSRWTAGDNSHKYTMERVDVSAVGTDSDNWGTSSRLFNNGLDANGSSIVGTPGKANTLLYILNGGRYITSDVTVPSNVTVYVDRPIIVATDTILTFEPGSTLSFYGTSGHLSVYGTTTFAGTDGAEVTIQEQNTNSSEIWRVSGYSEGVITATYLISDTVLKPFYLDHGQLYITNATFTDPSHAILARSSDMVSVGTTTISSTLDKTSYGVEGYLGSNVILNNITVEEGDITLMSLYSGSVGRADAITAMYTTRDMFYAEDGSNLTLTNSTFTCNGSRGAAAVLMINADSLLQNLIITGSWRGVIGINGMSSSTLSHISIQPDNLQSGIGIGSSGGNYPNVSMDNVTITNADSAAVTLSPAVGAVTITNSVFSNNSGYGIAIYGGADSFVMHNSTIADNLRGAIYSQNDFDRSVYDLTGNWWGDDTGPFQKDYNPEGLGDEIIGDFQNFDPWLARTPYEL